MLTITKHCRENDDIWDAFVMNNSINGTFLQTRNFLNYHKQGKFIDCSIQVSEGLSDIYAVFPACELLEEGKRVFYSHLGSTYGGPVISKKHYNITDVSNMLDTFETYIREERFSKVILKITPDLFSIEKLDLLKYLLGLRGYYQFSELSSYIDFSSYNSDIISNFTYSRRKQQKKCIAAGMKFGIIENDDDIRQFHQLLKNNLAKYNVNPVHTLEELLEFKNQRLFDIVKFYKVMLEDEMVGGGMSFYFNNTNIMHIQYSAAKQNMGTLSPMTFLFTGLITDSRDIGASKLSWGISTENKGKNLNMSLAETKESYGSKFSLNLTFQKEFTTDFGG